MRTFGYRNNYAIGAVAAIPVVYRSVGVDLPKPTGCMRPACSIIEIKAGEALRQTGTQIRTQRHRQRQTRLRRSGSRPTTKKTLRLSIPYLSQRQSSFPCTLKVLRGRVVKALAPKIHLFNRVTIQVRKNKR